MNEVAVDREFEQQDVSSQLSRSALVCGLECCTGAGAVFPRDRDYIFLKYRSNSG